MRYLFISAARRLAAGGFMALPLLMLYSCEKEIDFTYHDVAPLTVIEGALGGTGARVSLNLTTPMDEPMDIRCLTDATVVIDDLTAGSSRTLLPDSEGVFTDSAPGIPGHDYRLSVSRGGRVYQSDCRMEKPVEILSTEFQWISMPYDDVAVLSITLADDGSAENFYWIRLLRNGRPYQWVTSWDKNAEDGRLVCLAMTTRRDTAEEDDDRVLLDGDTVTAIVTPVSQQMYDYLGALNNDSNGASLFTGGECLGYFLASPASTASVVFRPDQIPLYR